MATTTSDKKPTKATCAHCDADLTYDGDWKLCAGCGFPEVACRCTKEPLRTGE